MSKFTKEMIDDYADKLLIGLTPEENKMVLDEQMFNDIENENFQKIKILLNQKEEIENLNPNYKILNSLK